MCHEPYVHASTHLAACKHMDASAPLSRALFEDFVGYLATLPLDKRGALMELLFEGEDFVLWPL